MDLPPRLLAIKPLRYPSGPPEWRIEHAAEFWPDPAGSPQALFSNANILKDDLPEIGFEWRDTPRWPTCLVMRSGRIHGENDVGFETWGPRGRNAFEAAFTRALDLAHGPFDQLAIWPRAGDAISDIPSILGFLKKHEAEGRILLLLDPAALLSRDMLATGLDHVQRICESVPWQQLLGVVAANVMLDANGDPRPCGLHEGVLPPPDLAKIIVNTYAPDAAVYLAGNDFGAQMQSITRA